MAFNVLFPLTPNNFVIFLPDDESKTCKMSEKQCKP